MHATATLHAVLADGYGHMDGAGNGLMWLWGGLMMLLLVAAFGLLAFAVVRSSRSSAPQPGAKAREILAERFARGEITSEEYRERASHLV